MGFLAAIPKKTEAASKKTPTLKKLKKELGFDLAEYLKQVSIRF